MAQRSLCHLDPFRGFWPVEKTYSPRANASRRLFHSKGEGPALGIADLFYTCFSSIQVHQLLFVLRAMTLRMPRMCAFQIAARVPNSNMCACVCSNVPNFGEIRPWTSASVYVCVCVCVCVRYPKSHLSSHKRYDLLNGQ